MTETALAHATVLAVWVLAAWILCGLGLLLARWLGVRELTWRGLSLAFWLGYAMTIVTLQLWHLVLPVNAFALVALVLLAVVGWRTRRGLMQVPWPRPRPVEMILGMTVLVWVANHALAPAVLYDSGMYHQPSVAWFNAFPVVPGLGNLHGRLAFNSSALLVGAAFDLGPFDGRAAHLSNALLVAVLLLEGLACCSDILRGRALRATDAFTIAIIPLAFRSSFRHDVHSLSTDLVVAALVLVSMRQLLDLGAREHDARESAASAGAAIILATSAMTVKLSAVVVALAIVLVASRLLWTAVPRTAGSAPLVVLLRTSAPASVLAGIWAIRGIILSGYPLYPVTLLSMPVDWRVPLDQARAESAWIVMSARSLNSGGIYEGIDWVSPWVNKVLTTPDPFIDIVLPGILTIVCLLLGVPAIRRLPWNRRWMLLWIVPLAGMTFWAATAPHTRMAQGLAWGIFGLSAAVLMGHLSMSRGAERVRQLVAGWTVVSVVSLLVLQASSLPEGGTPGDTRRGGLIVRGITGIDRHAPPATNEHRLADGTVIAVPIKDNSCWDLVACSPHPTAGLRRRSDLPVPASLRWGFRHEGQWLPERWPNPWVPFLPWWRCRHRGDAAACRRVAW